MFGLSPKSSVCHQLKRRPKSPPSHSSANFVCVTSGRQEENNVRSTFSNNSSKQSVPQSSWHLRNLHSCTTLVHCMLQRQDAHVILYFPSFIASKQFHISQNAFQFSMAQSVMCIVEWNVLSYIICRSTRRRYGIIILLKR